MERGPSEDGLASAWAAVVKEKGAYVSHGQPTQVPKGGNAAVFDAPMTVERGEIKRRVTSAGREDRWSLHPRPLKPTDDLPQPSWPSTALPGHRIPDAIGIEPVNMSRWSRYAFGRRHRATPLSSPC